MIILGIETSTFAGSLALIRDDSLLCEYSFNVGARHNEIVLPSIKRLLEDAGIEKEEIYGISVSAGPGSFTSLRVGISTAKALAFSLGIKLTSVSSLEILASNIFSTEHQICPVINAKKNEVYYGFFNNYDKLIRLTPDSFASPDYLCEIIKDKTVFLGEGALEYKGLLETKLGEKALFVPPNFNTAKASSCALLGRKRFLKNEFENSAAFAPNYLRKSEAEIKHQLTKEDK
ncbi:MAG: tRNA (adenosine(37)-N6)-threonylcarbamoyltransferase complex dimerization subunit type 1 TsaB [Thermodesulfobacteriota bacterium]